jgi:hypothetical protein
MRARVIACEVLYREVSLAVAKSPHVLDVRFMPFGLHSTPAELRERLQQEIREADELNYDYVLLGYGLCSRGTADLSACGTPLVIPRAHDCITLFLGSRDRYQKEFVDNPGTYYYSSGWIERGDGEVRQGFIEESKEIARKARFEDYKAKYGEENAQYLIEQESQWLANYSRAAYIEMGTGPSDQYRQFVRRISESRGWSYEEIPGDASLIVRLLNGDWDEDFLIVPAGASTRETFESDVIALCDAR